MPVPRRRPRDWSSSRMMYSGASACRRPASRTVIPCSSFDPKCRHHGRSHIGDWNGVTSGARRHNSSHSGASADSAWASVTRLVSTAAHSSRYNPAMGRLAMATFLVATAAMAQQDPVSRSWNQPVEPFRIIGNLFYVGASEVASYLVATPKGHIIIDGGFVETAPMIRANIEKLGFHFEDVRILLSTHAHFDHAGGLAALKDWGGATLMASERDAPILARGGK